MLPRVLRVTRLCRLVCLTVLVAWCAASPALAAEAGVGINNPDPVQVDGVAALGTHWARMFLSWRLLQPTPAPVSQADLAGWERRILLLPKGTKLILDVYGTPQWETGSANEHTPPANPADYARFIGTIARRFGGLVSAYEIWNEEDENAWWSGGPDPAAYARLLQAAYPAVKAAERKATVVLGGLTGNNYPFLEGVYGAGGKGSFDTVGVHTDTACNILSPYTYLRGANGRMIPDSFLAYREVHRVMLANGDDKPVWMTELSWRTTDQTCREGVFAGKKRGGVTDLEQARFLTQAYHCLAQDPYVQVALWFPIQDEGGIVAGLMRANGTPKPSFAAMADYVRRGDTLSEPCGVFTGPNIRVVFPRSRISYSGPLPIHVVASSSQGVFRITLKIDGKLIRNYGGHATPTSLSGVLDWQGAKHLRFGWHTLTFLAYDKELNVSQTSIRIFHRRLARRHK